jgi:hypothetical protein
VTTAEAIEGLTDPGKFEILAIRVLRYLHIECHTLAHLGVNAAGKTIPNPIDAFSLVSGSCPPRYVAAAFTLASRKELERKWLFEPDPSQTDKAAGSEGDLIKIARQAAQLRAAAADSDFVVYLCTNQRLSSELVHTVNAFARAHSLEIIFLEQSRLRDHLDSPAGQTLRAEFLDLPTNCVSRELVLKLAEASLGEYQIEGFDDGHFVPTGAWKEACCAVTKAAAIQLLVGRPGAGKSVIARSLLGQHISKGEIGLWVPGHILQEAASVPDAVRLVLKNLSPHLGEDAGHETCALASVDHPLLLVLDDPNRTDKPGRILEKVLGWGRSLFAAQTNESGGRIKLIVPVWETHWASLHWHYDGAQWLQSLTVGPMLREEAILCLRGRLHASAPSPAATDLNHIAERLRDDPILLTIFARLLLDDPGANAELILEDAIGSFIARSLSDLCLEKSLVEASCRSALLRATQQMLVRKSLHPSWTELQEWFAGDTMTLVHLGHIATHGHFCRLAKRGAHDIFEFRHDRILEHQLSEAMAVLMAGDADLRQLFDPFLTLVIGRAVTLREQSDHVLELVTSLLPCSLLAAFAYLAGGETVISERLCRRARGFLVAIDNAPDSIREDGFALLANTDSQHILPITADIASKRDVRYARMRNGDAAAGAAILSEKFFPSVNYPWLENLIAQAFARHGQEMLDQLSELLTAPTVPSDIKEGALTLAGYLADARMDAAILSAWRFLAGSSEFVLPGLWAAIRCTAEGSTALLDAIMPAIFSVSDEKQAGGWSDRREIFQELQHSIRHGIAPAVISALRALAERDERYRDFVFGLFCEIDHPIALEFVIRRVAKAAAKPVEAGHISGAYIWETQWRSKGGIEYRPMPSSCVDELQRLWQPDNPEWLRKYAFRIWIRFCGDRLWTVDLPEDLSSSEEAISERTMHGDRRVIGAVLQAITAKPHWIHLVRYFWSEDFEPVIDVGLKRGDSWSVEVLRDIPEPVAERLIISNWQTVQELPKGIQAALYIARESTVLLASESLARESEPSNVLVHVDHYFGFMDSGYSDRLSHRHLNVLRPYLSFISTQGLSHIIAFCGRHGFKDWAELNLVQECRRRLSLGADETIAAENRVLSIELLRWFPTDEELLSQLDRIEADVQDRDRGSVWFWTQQFIERLDDLGRMARVLEEWLRMDPSVRRLRLAALAIRYQGPRHSLEVLRRFIESHPDLPVGDLYLDAQYAVMRRSLT